jgi:integrase
VIFPHETLKIGSAWLVLSGVSTIHISTFERALLPAIAGAVLSIAAFSPAGTQAKPDFPTITVDSLPIVIEPPPTRLQSSVSDIKVGPATPRKRRGKSMTRRRGQDGSIETSGRWRVVRFWIDVPGQDARKHACTRICPVSGPGLLSATAQKRRAREIITESGADNEEHFAKVVTGNKVVTFKERAEWWLDWLQNRNNDPVPETSVPSIRSALDKWLIPNLGDLPLSEVGNGALKNLVCKMKGQLSPKSQHTYVGFAKEIRKSLVDVEGEVIFPVTWNNDFIALPRINRRLQRRGKVSAQDVERVIGLASKEWVWMLYILAPATGMRIAELLAVEIEKHVSPDCTMIVVRQQVKGSKIVQYLKTDAAHRVVDICPEAAELLRKFIGDGRGLLFPSKSGTTPVSYHNLLKRYITPDFERLGIKEPGKAAHSFRRFRASVLGMKFVAEDLKKFWMGHENHDITAQYAEQMFEMNEWRQTEAAKVGLGFNVPAFVPKPIVRKVRRSRKEIEVEVSS